MVYENFEVLSSTQELFSDSGSIIKFAKLIYIMNQGIFFGQIVIGPAGSGKVTLPPILVHLLQANAGYG